MPFAGGVFNLSGVGNPVVTGTTISSNWANSTLSDIAANGLSLTVLKDGSQTITANIPMNSFKFTGLSAGSGNGDSVRYEQIFPTLATTTINATTVNLTGALNEAKTTVASATTPDIWTSVANVVNYTGTTIATGFAAAPQAGARRTLVCAAAAPFTAGSNMLIQGYASGSTLTAAAGDQVDVVAITTTQFRLTIRPAAGMPIVGTSVPRNYIAGLTMSTAGSSTTMTIAAGQAADSTNVAIMNLSSSIGKTTGSWAVGTGNGGLDTGSIANSTWYHFYEIQRPDTQVTDITFSLSASSPTLPSNYTIYRRIGSGKTDGSGNWTLFVQTEDDFYWSTPPAADLNGAPGDTNAHLLTCTLPTGVKVKGYFNVGATDNGATGVGGFYMSDPNLADVAASSSATPLLTIGFVFAGATDNVMSQAQCWTNTSAQVRYRATTTSGTNRVVSIGWMDRRGRNS